MKLKRLHAMSSSQARRVQLTGVQLKEKFLSDYTLNNAIIPIPRLSVIENEGPSLFTLKAGTNWQFRLGRFEELDEIGYSIGEDGKTINFKSIDKIGELFYSGLMFRKYSFPANIFVSRNELNWVLFRSNEIIQYIVSNIRVRVLRTGRVKVDLFDQTTEKYKAIFTLEYRSEEHKKSFVFGAHGGGSGQKLQVILMNNCSYELLEVFNSSNR